MKESINQMQTLHYSTELITPQMAQEMLSHNTTNRAASKRHVDFYADIMKSGEWELNGEAIKFAKDGSLLDGQHRLMAVVESDTPVLFLVVRGLDKEVFKTLDTGKKRSDCDVFSIAGVKNYTCLAAIVRRVYVLRKLRRSIIGVGKDNGYGINQGVKMTAKSSLEEYYANRANYDKACLAACRYCSRINIIHKSEVGAMYYHLAYTLGHGEQAVEDFLDNLFGAENKYPIVTKLRDFLINDRMKKNENSETLSNTQRTQAVTRVWNAYISGRKRVNMKWKKGDEIEFFK